jgi:hypothetical protein
LQTGPSTGMISSICAGSWKRKSMENQISDELWAETTWDGNRRAQLRQALTLTLRERLQAVEDMGEVAERFREMRSRHKSPVREEIDDPRG